VKIDDFSAFHLRFPLPSRYGDAQGLKTQRATERPLRPGADGLVAVPAGPGLGVVVNEDLVRRYGERTLS
jgi:L-alanine-DL-glutamate epimerase-like enolase superfamily enzyme